MKWPVHLSTPMAGQRKKEEERPVAFASLQCNRSAPDTTTAATSRPPLVAVVVVVDHHDDYAGHENQTTRAT